MRDLSVFIAVKIRVEIFWVVAPCSVVVGYQRFGHPCCLHLQGEVVLKDESSMDL